MATVDVRRTPAATILGGILVAMLWGAINYDNNLAYFVLFLIFSLAWHSRGQARKHLAGLKIFGGKGNPVFAGESFEFHLWLENTSKRPLHRVECQLDSEALQTTDFIFGESKRLARFSFTTKKRGRYSISSLHFSSEYPLGIFRANVEIPVDIEYVVYPHPEGQAEWPEASPDLFLQDEGKQPGGDDFEGLSAYRPGESQRHIDWKAVARGRPLAVKRFAGGSTGRIWLDWRSLTALDTEKKLSQLALWVVEAEKAGCTYGLWIPGFQREPSQGAVHYHACLTALGCYEG